MKTIKKSCDTNKNDTKKEIKSMLYTVYLNNT